MRESDAEEAEQRNGKEKNVRKSKGEKKKIVFMEKIGDFPVWQRDLIDWSLHLLAMFRRPMEKRMQDRRNEKAEKPVVQRQRRGLNFDWPIVRHGPSVDSRQVRVEQFSRQGRTGHLKVQQPERVRMDGTPNGQNEEKSEEDRSKIGVSSVTDGVTRVFEDPQRRNEAAEHRQRTKKMHGDDESEDRNRSTEKIVQRSAERLSSARIQLLG